MNANGPTTSFLRDDGAPDWDAISFDVCCSRCGYNLRTLTRPLCPECGLTFEWAEVVNRSATASDYSFEHNWQSRPIVTWLVTIWRSFHVRRFWEAASIHDHVVPQALWLMMLAALVLFPLTLHGGAFFLSIVCGIGGDLIRRFADVLNSGSGFRIGDQVDAVSELLLFIAELSIDEGLLFLLLSIGGATVYLLAGLGMISSLHQTLGRCRVRPVQVLRVVAHAAAPICVLLPIVFLIVAIGVNLAGNNGNVAGPFVFVAYASLVVIPGYFLSAGLKYYLHLPRPRVLGYVAALVASMTLFTVVTLMIMRCSVWS